MDGGGWGNAARAAAAAGNEADPPRRLMTKAEYLDQIAAMDMGFALDNPLYTDREVKIVLRTDEAKWKELLAKGSRPGDGDDDDGMDDEEEEDDESKGEEEEEDSLPSSASGGGGGGGRGKKRRRGGPAARRQRVEEALRALGKPLREINVISATLATRSAYFRGMFEIAMLDARLMSVQQPNKRALVLGAEDEDDAALIKAVIAGMHHRKFPTEGQSVAVLASMLAKCQEFLAEECVTTLCREIAQRATFSPVNNYHYAEWDTRKPPLPLEEVMHVFEALPPGIEGNPGYPEMMRRLDKVLQFFFFKPDLYWTLTYPPNGRTPSWASMHVDRHKLAEEPPAPPRHNPFPNLPIPRRRGHYGRVGWGIAGFGQELDGEPAKYIPLEALSPKTLKHLLASENIRIRHENTLFMMLNVYMAKRDWKGEYGDDAEAFKQAVYDDILPSLRFPRMSADYLADVVSHTPLFNRSPKAVKLLSEAFVFKSLSRLRQERWIKLVRGELAKERRIEEFHQNSKDGVQPGRATQRAMEEAAAADHRTSKPLKSEPFRGTDVESSFARLPDRVHMRQTEHVDFAVDFLLEDCLQLLPGQCVHSNWHECCGYMWHLRFCRLPAPRPDDEPSSSNDPPAPKRDDRVGIWLHLLNIAPPTNSPFPHSKPRGLAALIQMVVGAEHVKFKMLPDVNHTWVVFGGREGRDNVKFPQVIDGVGFDGPGARNVINWDQIVRRDSPYFENGKLRVVVQMRTED